MRFKLNAERLPLSSIVVGHQSTYVRISLRQHYRISLPLLRYLSRILGPSSVAHTTTRCAMAFVQVFQIYMCRLVFW